MLDKSSTTPVANNREYYFSGTVGDAYIALCKIASLGSSGPHSLRRLCRHAGSDTAIAEIATLFPNVNYNPDFIQFTSIEDMREYAFRNADRYINIFWDGKGRDNEPDDPQGMVFVEFPPIKLQRISLSARRHHVGIQLHSGSRVANRRQIETAWIAQLCRLLAHSSIGVVLLGTGEGYSVEELGQLQDLPENVINLIGPSKVLEWFSQLIALDYLVSPEGVATFFGLSQRVPTLVVYTEQSALLRMPAAWRNISICVRPLAFVHSGGDERWVPIPAHVAASILLARFDPEAA